MRASVQVAGCAPLHAQSWTHALLLAPECGLDEGGRAYTYTHTHAYTHAHTRTRALTGVGLQVALHHILPAVAVVEEGLDAG